MNSFATDRTGPATGPRVLVLLATYNGATHLAEQLRSLARQTAVSLQVLLSDDGSSDATLAIARAEASACRLHLSILPHAGRSGSAAQNFFRLLREADHGNHDFVALCDQDDIWLDDKLERACSQLDRTHADAYCCNAIAFWADGRTKALRKNQPQRRFDHLFESASQGCTYVLRAGVAGRFARFLADHPVETGRIHFHDWLLYAWARSQGMAWWMDDASCIRYRQTDNNVIGANSGLAAIVRRLKLMHAGWLRDQSLRCAECIGMSEHPVVRRLRRFGWRDRLFLAGHARWFRRNPRDQLVFFLACLTIGI